MIQNIYVKNVMIKLDVNIKKGKGDNFNEFQKQEGNGTCSGCHSGGDSCSHRAHFQNSNNGFCKWHFQRIREFLTHEIHSAKK